MLAGAEGDLRVGIAPDIDVLGIIEDIWVPVGAGDTKMDEGAFRNDTRRKLHIFRRFAVGDLQWALQAQEFFHRRLDQGGIVQEALQFAGVFQQGRQPMAGHAGGGLVAGVKQEYAVLHQFLVG